MKLYNIALTVVLLGAILAVGPLSLAFAGYDVPNPMGIMVAGLVMVVIGIALERGLGRKLVA